MSHELGWRNDRATLPLLGRVIGQIAGDQKIRRTRERNGEKRLVILVGQVQIGLSAGINGQTVLFKFVQHFADSPGVKLKSWAREYVGVLSQDAVVVANLHSTSQRQ